MDIIRLLIELPSGMRAATLVLIVWVLAGIFSVSYARYARASRLK